MRAPVKDLADKQVFITGAASGIGKATAHHCAAQGAWLFLTDVDGDGLAEVVSQLGARVRYGKAINISDHDGVRALTEEITARYGAMDVVMNVAGIAAWGTVTAMPHRTWERLIEVNLLGPISVLEYLVPPMIEAGRGGQIVNVSSAAGIIGMPWHAGYSASKFGLRGVSEVLRFDLARHRIGVSLVCPGGVDTGLTETVEIAGVDKASARFATLQQRFKKRAVTPERAAAAIVDGITRNRFWVYTSLDIRLIHLLQRYVPGAYVFLMAVMNRVANRALPEVAQAKKDEQ